MAEEVDYKLIKGQAWVSNGKLVQDQIAIFPGGKSTSNVVVLIEDIWADLLTTGTYKTNGKGYFYWEVETTNIGDDDLEEIVFIECPRPRDEDFEKLESATGEWAEYWSKRYKTALENAEKYLAIQKKEIVFPGTNYLNQYGEMIQIDEKKETTNELGSIANLLSMF